MEDNLERKILEIVFFKKLGVKREERLAKGTVNKVYKITDNKGENWIIKILRNESWPSIEKMKLIEERLEEANVDRPSLVDFGKNDDFPKGYLIYRYIKGIDVDEILGSKLSYEEYYQKLGELMRKIHKIRLIHFGDVIRKEKMFEMFDEWISYKLTRSAYKEGEWRDRYDDLKNKIVKEVWGNRQNWPVLCHRDVSPKNIRFYDNKVILMDWDNATSELAEVDVGVMRYWAYFREEKDRYDKNWEIFKKSYGIDSKDFERKVKIQELVQGLGLLSWYGQENIDLEGLAKTEKRVKELVNELRL